MRDELEAQRRCGAVRMGFTPSEPKNVGEALSFTKGAQTVLLCTHNGRCSWAVATLIDNHYSDHNYHGELQAALDDAFTRDAAKA